MELVWQCVQRLNIYLLYLILNNFFNIYLLYLILNNFIIIIIIQNLRLGYGAGQFGLSARRLRPGSRYEMKGGPSDIPGGAEL